MRSTLTLCLTLAIACILVHPNASAQGAGLFVDGIAQSSWINLDVTPDQGTAGLRQALNTARDSYPSQPVRIRLAPGLYADNLGSEVFAQHLLRSATTPVYVVATNPAPNATQLGQGINLLGVSYVAIDGLTIGPATVGAWNGATHSAPQPLQASAGIHVAGAALNANQNAAAGGVLNTSIYGRYQPSHHIIVRNVTIQNIFELDAQSGETSIGQGMDGMKFNQVEDLWVLNNTVSQTSRHGLDNVGVHRATYSNNVIARTGGGLGIEAKGGSTDVTFDSNTFYKIRRVALGGEGTDATYYFSADGLWSYEGLRIIARNNLIIDAREAALDFSGCADCTAVANTILFSAGYKVPIDQGTVFGGDAIRVHDSTIEGTADGAGSDCQFWNGADYVTVDPCWGVGANASSPAGRVLRSSNVTVIDNVFASVNGSFSDALGGSTLPCPLNVLGGTADLHFDANYWWNGPRPLPATGCTGLPEGPHSVLSTTSVVASPGFSAYLDDSSLAVLASSAVSGLTPPASSVIVKAGIASAALTSVDRVGQTRAVPTTMGALESNATALVAISASRVFSYAQSNYSTFFAGNPTADQITYLGRHYDYRYYPATSNYLAVDTMGGIWILGPISNNAFTSVGAVESFRNAITAWEATQPH
ncbi:MAG: right-handed parallel beta-helix repeat-containing protein [Burkholderiales bacterium]